MSKFMENREACDRRRVMMRKVLLLFGFFLFCGPVALADIHVRTEHLRLTLDAQGQLRSAFSCYPACAGESVRIQQFGEDGVIDFDRSSAGGWRLTESRAADHYELYFQHPGGASVRWRIPESGYLIELELSGIEGLNLRSGESFRPRAVAGFGSWLERSRYVLLDKGGVRQIALTETDPDPGAQTVPAIGWLGYRNRYWALMARPTVETAASLRTEEGAIKAEIRLAAAAGVWSIYLGPIEPRVLKRVAPELTGLTFAGLWFWVRWIGLGMFYLLAWIQALVHSWGVAVVCLSVAVTILMFPLNRFAGRLQQEVQETEARLAPELGRIRKRHEGKDRIARIQELYKSEDVHFLYRLKGMLGHALLIPVFIGAFIMLAGNIHLLNTGFLWISDLSRTDDLFQLPFQLPFFGGGFNLLPFLMTALSIIASLLHYPLALNHDLRIKKLRNTGLLALVMLLLFYTFPAGVVLYWTTHNLISVIKNLWAYR